MRTLQASQEPRTCWAASPMPTDDWVLRPHLRAGPPYRGPCTHGRATDPTRTALQAEGLTGTLRTLLTSTKVVIQRKNPAAAGSWRKPVWDSSVAGSSDTAPVRGPFVSRGSGSCSRMTQDSEFLLKGLRSTQGVESHSLTRQVLRLFSSNTCVGC